MRSNAVDVQKLKTYYFSQSLLRIPFRFVEHFYFQCSLYEAMCLLRFTICVFVTV